MKKNIAVMKPCCVVQLKYGNPGKSTRNNTECHNAHSTPVIKLAYKALYLDCSLGRRYPLQPNSSPNPAVTKNTNINGMTLRKGILLKSGAFPLIRYIPIRVAGAK
jgi:hypothetical protein